MRVFIFFLLVLGGALIFRKRPEGFQAVSDGVAQIGDLPENLGAGS